MGGVHPEIVHLHLLEGLVHPAADFTGLHPHVFQRKGHVFLHYVGHQLVVGILEHHANPAADLIQVFFLCRIKSVDGAAAPGGNQDGVEEFGQGGFPGAILPQDG